MLKTGAVRLSETPRDFRETEQEHLQTKRGFPEHCHGFSLSQVLHLFPSKLDPVCSTGCVMSPHHPKKKVGSLTEREIVMAYLA